MSYPYTESGYNMYDMLSMLQKSIRRGDYESAGFAASQLTGGFRTVMWNRIFVISAEDCFGVITKELVELRKKDECTKDNKNISNAVALLCRSKKSRDACYFACNFVLASRNARKLSAAQVESDELYQRIKSAPTLGTSTSKETAEYDSFGFEQTSLFSLQTPSVPSSTKITKQELEKSIAGVHLQTALKHRDMDMVGYEIDMLRRSDRDFLWGVFADYATNSVKAPVTKEIAALTQADDIVNRRKKALDKDEIFVSKAAVLLCHCEDTAFNTVQSSDVIRLEHNIDWSSTRIKPIDNCMLKGGKVPDWVYDCHTLKGRQMGKTDWDMTTAEQAALHPLQLAYFDDASWIYTYEQDFENNAITLDQMRPIRAYAKTHSANPVKHIPYVVKDI